MKKKNFYEFGYCIRSSRFGEFLLWFTLIGFLLYLSRTKYFIFLNFDNLQMIFPQQWITQARYRLRNDTFNGNYEWKIRSIRFFFSLFIFDVMCCSIFYNIFFSISRFYYVSTRSLNHCCCCFSLLFYF